MCEEDTCDIYCENETKVHRVRQYVQQEDLKSVALLFKVIADRNRAMICYALCQEEELCVCDLANIIDSSIATASHHLRTLHKQGIVKYRKDGKLVFYSLDDGHIRQLIQVALEHAKEGKANVESAS